MYVCMYFLKAVLNFSLLFLRFFTLGIKFLEKFMQQKYTFLKSR
jgi:hypothetical protein